MHTLLGKLPKGGLTAEMPPPKLEFFRANTTLF
jgi:hypothetical protein